MSNNRTKRSIKPFMIDRKNFLFANTPGSAQSSTVIFSLIETAKEDGLDPYRYLLHVAEDGSNFGSNEGRLVAPAAAGQRP